MTAQPHRLRGLRLPDENAILPQNMAAKTAHQRNKSTPAVTALLQNAAVRPSNPQAKRTAFADVSNTTRTAHIHKDEAASVKPSGETDSNNIHVSAPQSRPLEPASRVSAPLSKLAQRFTNGSVKTAATTSQIPPHVSTLSSANAQLHTAKSTVDTRSGPVARKVRSKKSLVISKDGLSGATATAEPQFSSRDMSIDGLQAGQATTQIRVPSHGITAVAKVGQVNMPVRLSAGPIVPSQSTAMPGTQPYSTALSTQTEQQLLLALEQQAQALETERNANLADGNNAMHDQLEYYHTEEGQTYYQDGSSHSGRSYRNKTETTATSIVLAPKYTTRVRQEIEYARTNVNAARTPEEQDDELWDTSMVAEYSEEIFAYMRELETRMTPNAHYMDHQTECQWSMRAVLMDWLIQVHQRFGLLPETLFLSVNYIDRFLSLKVVSLPKLQLVGATAIFLASKFEEVNCPSIAEIVYMVDNGYNADEILKAERFMLSMLTFDLGWPGPMSFLRRISKADDYDLETRTLAKYFLEVTIMDERFVACPPSFTAAGAHCLARLLLRKGDWSQAHVYYSDYTYSQLHQQIKTILECCEDAEEHHGVVFEKYKDKRFKRASIFVKQELRNGFQLPALPSPTFHDSPA